MQPRSEETRGRLLQAALQAFAQSGYDATSVYQICQTAGVSKGGFYYHFPTKQAIFLQLLEDWLSDLDRQLADFRKNVNNIPDALMDMASVAEYIFRVASGTLPMFLEFWSQASRDPTIWQTSIAPYRRYQNYFSGLLEEGIDQGSLASIDATNASRAIVALAVGLLLQGLLDPEGADWGQVAKDGMRYMVQGMQRGVS